MLCSSCEVKRDDYLQQQNYRDNSDIVREWNKSHSRVVPVMKEKEKLHRDIFHFCRRYVYRRWNVSLRRLLICRWKNFPAVVRAFVKPIESYCEQINCDRVLMGCTSFSKICEWHLANDIEISHLYRVNSLWKFCSVTSHESQNAFLIYWNSIV